MLTDANCTVTITNGGGQVNFKSGKYVKLNPGFHSVQGSKFHTELTDCQYAVY
ncbi:MAG: 3-coathanger stack domain-containing protein [Saprospiraceae bacterium]